MGNKIKLTESQLKGLITRVANRILKENKNYKHPNLSLEQLQQKYPEIKFTKGRESPQVFSLWDESPNTFITFVN